MVWRLLGFGVVYYLVLMFLGAIAQLKQWRGIHLICMYALTTGLGIVVAALLSVLLGHIFPRLALPVFIVLSLSWFWFGWRDAGGGMN
jgi:hypothetical protein